MSEAVKQLARSALAIPGLVSMAQAAAPADSEAGYQYTYYTEDDSPESRSKNGAQERYTIQVHQFYLMMPYGSNMSWDVEGSFETMSGASPVYTYTDADDVTMVYMAGASIERRFDLYGSGRYYWSQADIGGQAGISVEQDYLALSSGIDGSLQINDQMTTLSGGATLGYDFIDPTQDHSDPADQQANNPGRFAAKDQTKWQVSLFEGISQIIDMNTVVQAGASLTHQSGYLSDPYRERAGADVPFDIRPDNRTLFTLSAAGRRYFSGIDGALHLDFRFLADTWDIMSTTMDLAWYQNYAPGWGWFVRNEVDFQLVPSIRYYQQTAAYFYEIPEDDPQFYAANKTTHYYSSDARLSKYGALSLGLALKTDFRNYSWTVTGERYAANPSYGFNFDAETPGLPAFWRVTTGLDYRF